MPLRSLGNDRGILTPRRLVVRSSEMDQAAQFTTTVSGGTVSFTTASLAAVNRYGIAELATGITTTGRAAVNSPAMDQLTAGSGLIRFTAILKTPSALSDATNRYSISTGLGNSATVLNPGVSIIVRYRDNINSGKWQIFTNAISGASAIDTGITVAVDTWYRIEMEVAKDSSNCLVWINSAQVGSFSSSGGIPTGTTEAVGAVCLLLKSAGTTSRTMYLDYMDIVQEIER